MSATRRGPADLKVFMVRQLPLLLAANAVYLALRVLVEGGEARSRANAATLLDVERALQLDLELGLQEIVLAHDWLVDLSNLVYVWLYWPFVLFALVLVHHLDRTRYLALRDAIFASGAIGIVFFAAVPVAPPRFLPEYTGTVGDAARQHFVRHSQSWANEYAALPSFHAGWTLIASIVLALSLRPRWARALALVPGVVMSVAVVSTGNHYVIDFVVGDAISIGMLAVAWRWHAARARKTGTTTVQQPLPDPQP